MHHNASNSNDTTENIINSFWNAPRVVLLQNIIRPFGSECDHATTCGGKPMNEWVCYPYQTSLVPTHLPRSNGRTGLLGEKSEPRTWNRVRITAGTLSILVLARHFTQPFMTTIFFVKLKLNYFSWKLSWHTRKPLHTLPTRRRPPCLCLFRFSDGVHYD